MKELWRRIARAGVSAIGVWILAGATIAVAEECRNRGQLDTLYCDDDNDLVADVPSDPKKLRDPSTLVFAYTPVEDPAVYQNVFKPFTEAQGRVLIVFVSLPLENSGRAGLELQCRRWLFDGVVADGGGQYPHDRLDPGLGVD